jgi:hypothetical protein
MKKLMLILAAFFTSTMAAVHAQEIIIDSISGGFNGVYATEHNNVFYTYFFTDKGKKETNDLVVKIYDAHMGLQKSVAVEVSKTAKVMTAAVSGHLCLFYLADDNKKTITRLIFDREGKVQSKNESKASAADLDIRNYPMVYPAMPMGFVIVIPITDKKGGYKMENIDMELKTKWNKSFSPAKGSWEIMYATAALDKVMLLIKEKEGGNTSYFIQNVQSEQGESRPATYIKDEAVAGLPYFYNNILEQSVIGGTYYEGGVSEGKSDGMFFTLIGPAGDKQFFFKLPWSLIKGKLSGQLAQDIANGNAMLYPQDIVRSRDSFVVICEVYTKPVRNGGEASFKVRDFVFINVDMNGQIGWTNVIENKEHTVAVKNDLAKDDDLAIVKFAHDKGYFDYRPLGIQGEMARTVVYKNEDAELTEVRFLPYAHTNEASPMAPGAPIDKFPLKRRKNSTNYIVDGSAPPSKNIMGAAHGFVLIYDYMPPKLGVSMVPIPAAPR